MAIKITVRTFSLFREIIGRSQLSLDLAEGATVEQLLERLSADFPQATQHLSQALVAVNHTYVGPDHRLTPGDEVAVFPLVGGGGGRNQFVSHVVINADPLDVADLVEQVSEPGTGSVVSFTGVVRAENLGRQVSYLEYEAYPEMARAKFLAIIQEARARWPLLRGIAIGHRTGRLEIGQIAMVAAVATAHREDGGFEAARYIIDRTKEIVPIWKKETWADGEQAEWVQGDYVPQPGE
jgi:molybdopterin synthase catalytic subunit